ncbi:5-carboxymethyl-2-hydroxymuconate Delta-isomerase [Pseudoprimorskyibacter insulae]|uniref:5-carboxymethyl-2-hydroxymuconate Delta-isomerase n=1 Tax=Pseudoprimorskyibacter insulae TaxID=1695997 RepID=A0A2R8B0J6_9RHOB|nr:5-carboxymethyl-2-hydroxymuconate Delta-isomerase [Pseudoprimorskyibacter insulae]SPF81644.1 5-carboxymethyl-2-hydroxymuconate Delta-isomerase [Pseudoprimorskyibacter insulae]
MAHLSMEYSGGLEQRADMAKLAGAAHQAMLDAGIFPVAGIRVRLHKADIAIVADGLPENDFLAMTLSVGAGRSTQALKQAGDVIFDAVRGALAGPLATEHFALSLEIRVIDPALSWKDTPIHARLSAQKKD